MNNNTFSLKIRNTQFTFDVEDLHKLMTDKNESEALIRWKLDNENDENVLFHYDNNYKPVYLIDLIMGEKCHNNITFKDNDTTNYSKQNLVINRENIIFFDNNIYCVKKKYKGHIKSMGKTAGKVRNSIYKVINVETNEIRYLMQCNDDYTMISYECRKSIKKYEEQVLTWYKLSNGYIGTHIYIDDKQTIMYLHQYITGHYGNGQGQDSVDHINRNKLDNRIENLRIISQSEQNKNTGKRARKYNAKDLPDGITQDMLPKYVVYYNECYNKEKDLYRDFFKIEKHPKQEGKEFCSSKSTKISIQDKLTEIIDMLNRIENNEEIIKVTDKTTYNLAKGTYIKDNKDGSQHLILDLRQDGERYNLKMKCKKNLSMADNYKLFEEKINDKYEDIELQY